MTGDSTNREYLHVSDFLLLQHGLAGMVSPFNSFLVSVRVKVNANLVFLYSSEMVNQNHF